MKESFNSKLENPIEIFGIQESQLNGHTFAQLEKLSQGLVQESDILQSRTSVESLAKMIISGELFTLQNESGDIVSCVALVPTMGKQYELGTVFTPTEYRQQGYAKKLMSDLVDKLKQTNKEVFFITHNEYVLKMLGQKSVNISTTSELDENGKFVETNPPFDFRSLYPSILPADFDPTKGDQFALRDVDEVYVVQK
jgi:N-acetylglutamate synthase-like GNAT family acetyltransferase